MRAFGRWGIRVADSRSLITQVVGTQGAATADKIQEYFEGELVQKLSDALANYFVAQGVSVFAVNARLNDLSTFTTDQIAPEFGRFGIEIVNFNVERISIPDDEKAEFQRVLGKRMELEQLSSAPIGQGYVTARSFDTLQKAAENPGGAAGNLLAAGLGAGMGLAAGVPVGAKVAQAVSVAADAPVDGLEQKLTKLKKLLDAELITPEDFNAKKQKLLEDL